METQRKESAESSGKTDRRKALESVGDLVKLQITLGTGTIVFSGSVLGNILSSESHTLGHQAFLLSSGPFCRPQSSSASGAWDEWP